MSYLNNNETYNEKKNRYFKIFSEQIRHDFRITNLNVDYSLQVVIKNIIEKYDEFAIQLNYNDNRRNIYNEHEIVFLRETLYIFNCFKYYKFHNESEIKFIKRVIKDININKEINAEIIENVIKILYVYVNMVEIMKSHEKEKEIKEKEKEKNKEFLLSLKERFGRDLCGIILKY